MRNSADRLSEVEGCNDANAGNSSLSSEVYGSTQSDGLLNLLAAPKANPGTAVGDDGFELFDSNSDSETEVNPGAGEERLGEERKKQIGSESSDVTVANVTQGDIGNCFFMSSLASLANTPEGQDAIRDMVTMNENGSATVTFPGDRSHPITVTQADIDENIKNGNVDEGSDTLMQIQTAFLKYDRAEQYGTGINEIQRHGIPLFGQVMDATAALHLLTGEETASKVSGLINSSFNVGGANSENVQRFLQQALENGQPVVAGTPPWADEPIVSAHAYSVLDYDPAKDLVTVRNPWGHNTGNGIENVGDCKNGITNIGDGKLTMSYETFYKNFAEVMAAGVNPTESRIGDIANDVGNIIEHNANLTADVLKGRFSEVLPDVTNLLKSYTNLSVDFPTTLLNESESVFGARFRGLYNTVSELAHGDLPSLTDVSNAAVVPKPIIDAAKSVVSDVGDFIGSIF